MSVPPQSWWGRLWQPFWTLPAVICAMGVTVGLLLPPLEQRVAHRLPFVFQGGPEGARSVLGTIASAMISVTGLVFSITMVVLQLASSQFTPRVLGAFLSSRITQVTLGVFTASFVFALSVLRYVQGEGADRDKFVPQVSVTLAFVLVLASVGCFLGFIHHITTSIQVSQVISRVGDETAQVLDRLYPTDYDDGPQQTATWSPTAGTARVVVTASGRHGSVTHVDAERLLDLAQRLDAVITVDVQVGAFVTVGQQIARVWGREELEAADHDEVRRRIWLGDERQLRHEVGYGLRQLVDIADRALSPGINDPTTAILVVNEIHRLLRTLVTREMPSPYVCDPDGTVRVVDQPQAIEGLIAFGVREIGHYSAGTQRVEARLTTMLTDLQECALPRYRAIIETLLDELRHRSHDDDEDLS